MGRVPDLPDVSVCSKLDDSPVINADGGKSTVQFTYTQRSQGAFRQLVLLQMGMRDAKVVLTEQPIRNRVDHAFGLIA